MNITYLVISIIIVVVYIAYQLRKNKKKLNSVEILKIVIGSIVLVSLGVLLSYLLKDIFTKGGNANDNIYGLIALGVVITYVISEIKKRGKSKG